MSEESNNRKPRRWRRTIMIVAGLMLVITGMIWLAYAIDRAQFAAHRSVVKCVLKCTSVAVEDYRYNFETNVFNDAQQLGTSWRTLLLKEKDEEQSSPPANVSPGQATHVWFLVPSNRAGPKERFETTTFFRAVELDIRKDGKQTKEWFIVYLPTAETEWQSPEFLSATEFYRLTKEIEPGSDVLYVDESGNVGYVYRLIHGHDRLLPPERGWHVPE